MDGIVPEIDKSENIPIFPSKPRTKYTSHKGLSKEEKKELRRKQNREAARRARMKKAKQREFVDSQIDKIKKQIDEMERMGQIDSIPFQTLENEMDSLIEQRAGMKTTRPGRMKNKWKAQKLEKARKARKRKKVSGGLERRKRVKKKKIMENELPPIVHNSPLEFSRQFSAPTMTTTTHTTFSTPYPMYTTSFPQPFFSHPSTTFTTTHHLPPPTFSTPNSRDFFNNNYNSTLNYPQFHRSQSAPEYSHTHLPNYGLSSPPLCDSEEPNNSNESGTDIDLSSSNSGGGKSHSLKRKGFKPPSVQISTPISKSSFGSALISPMQPAWGIVSPYMGHGHAHMGVMFTPVRTVFPTLGPMHSPPIFGHRPLINSSNSNSKKTKELKNNSIIKMEDTLSLSNEKKKKSKKTTPTLFDAGIGDENEDIENTRKENEEGLERIRGYSIEEVLKSISPKSMATSTSKKIDAKMWWLIEGKCCLCQKEFRDGSEDVGDFTEHVEKEHAQVIASLRKKMNVA